MGVASPASIGRLRLFRQGGRGLRLANGSQVPLPILVPSFSSKGFPTHKDEDLKQIVSDAYSPFKSASAILEEAFLLSAFDLHHGFLPATNADLHNSEIVFIDSGGYEKSPFFDATEPIHHPFPNPPFSLDDYSSVLKSLDTRLPIVVASPDWHTLKDSIDQQISFAQDFLAPFAFSKNFILKPGDKTYLRVEDLMPHIGSLNAFDILGVTEKELGRNLKDRLRAVAKLRVALDDVGLGQMPIHIWGGLDPVITPLYFFAGAEIFDGLSWLRYAFHRGTAIYRDAKQILDGGVGRSYGHSHMQVLVENLSVLRRLTASLRMFEEKGRADFAAFEWHGDDFKRAFQELTAEIPEMGRLTNGR